MYIIIKIVRVFISNFNAIAELFTHLRFYATLDDDNIPIFIAAL